MLPFLAGIAAALLGGCTLPAATAPGAPTFRPVSLQRLPGWQEGHQAGDLPVLLRDCERLSLLPPDQALGGSGLAAQLGGKAGRWADICADARRTDPTDDAVRAFLERDFAAYQLGAGGRSTMLFTGYFEPRFRGSRERGGAYQTPIYALPDDLVRMPDGQGGQRIGRMADNLLAPYDSRARIDAGSLAGRAGVIAWLADPIDAFFLQIQGSGRIVLPDGAVIRVGYAGHNGLPYTPIGQVLIRQRQMTPDQVTAQSIRAWLAAHPDQARTVMEQNQDYVFFREVPGLRPQDGPPGALNTLLTPGRSVAVDKAFIPLAAPLWVATTDPLDGRPFRRLMQAEDQGGAIKTPLRADLFYGWGPDAEQRAGKAHQTGTGYVLLPRPPASAPRH